MYKKSRILYAKPSISEKEVSYVLDAVRNGWGETCYEWLERFEQKFCKYVGTKHAIATSSATGALHLGLAALGIGQGDEVILADTNWIASVAPSVHLGANPVFVDILPDTWCIDPVHVEKSITPHTKAIIAVHLYGNLCNMDALEDIAARHHLHLIEDAAEAIGSRWGNCRAGSRGTFGVFSLHGTKTVTTGEGGVLVTNNDELAVKARMLNNHGRAAGDKRQFWADCVGYKFRMSNIQAALGCAQMERVEELIARRREIFFTYKELLRGCSSISMNPVPKKNEEYGYWMPTVVFSEESGVLQRHVLAAFQTENIDGRAFFSPLSKQAGFLSRPENINSWNIALRAVNLPSYHDMTDEELERVGHVILGMIGRKS